MDADWSVELCVEDESLEFPWYASDSLRWLDLRAQPELIGSLTEVADFPELSSALTALNAPHVPLQTAKCDIWFEDQPGPGEDVYEASCRLSSYIDVLFVDERQFSFRSHEQLADIAVQLLKESTDLPAAVELVVRRCLFRSANGVLNGFYITTYVSGYGNTHDEARSRWVLALAATAEALRAASQSDE